MRKQKGKHDCNTKHYSPSDGERALKQYIINNKYQTLSNQLLDLTTRFPLPCAPFNIKNPNGWISGVAITTHLILYSTCS